MWVAGSNGKTSTKDMLASVLGVERNVLRSEPSFNNDVGVPATLLQLGPEHEAAVVELGTNHPGELYPWCKWRLQIMECSQGLDASIWNFLATCRAWLKRRGCWRSCYRLVENFSCMVMEIGLSQSANALGLTLSAWALGRQ